MLDSNRLALNVNFLQTKSVATNRQLPFACFGTKLCSKLVIVKSASENAPRLDFMKLKMKLSKFISVTHEKEKVTYGCSEIE